MIKLFQRPKTCANTIQTYRNSLATQYSFSLTYHELHSNMIKFSLFVSFTLNCAFMRGSVAFQTIGTSETSWSCPSVTEVGTSCQCHEMMSSIHCNGATYQEMETFFYKLKSDNPDESVHVESFRMENYANTTLDVQIFSPCTEFDSGWGFLCVGRTNLTFGTMDFRGNRNLKHLGSLVGRGWVDINEIDKIVVQNLLLSNCSVNSESYPGENRLFYGGLNMFGDKLEYIDFSQNHLTTLIDRQEVGFNWPNLKTFNLSRNQITDFGFAWFHNAPNVDVIDLSYNYIHHIRTDAFTMNSPFHHKMDMEIIYDFSNNRLTQTSTFHESIFTNLIRPTTFLLNQNDFNHLPESVFQSVMNRRGTLIDMSDNRLICNCKSEWLRSMALIYDDRMINYNCLNLNNISIFEVEENLCVN